MESLVGQVADEFTERLNRGEHPDIEEYARRYPEIAHILRQALPALQAVGALVPGSLPGDEADLEQSPLAGCLGDFRIIRQIGRGGMGIVYEAEQISLGRRVALKMLPFAAALDSKQLQRFKNEAHAAAHLQHQNIVPVYFVGCERGVHFYAMQFVEGQTLAALIQELRQLEGRPGEARREGEAPAEPRPLGSEAAEPLENQARQGTPAYSPRPPEDLASELISGRWAPAKLGSADSPPTGPYVPSPPVEQSPQATTVTPPVGALSTEHSRRRPAFFRTVANLGIQAAEALEHAHELGVIHRDVKPANLMVDARGNLWITDFGLAHCQSGSDLTMSGDLLGTLRYMSPEQALAKRVIVDERTDIYSLGATLYELLTLEPAFPGTDRQEVLRQIAFEDPKPPRRLSKAIPVELETIVLKAMEKNPADRYATAQELADDLERWLKNEPIRARRPALVQRFRKWARRHPGVVATAAVALGVMLLALAVSNLLITQQKNQKDDALREKDDALREKGRALVEKDDALTKANDNFNEAEKQSKLALERQKLAEQTELLARRRFYAAQINLAHAAWQAGEVARVLELLEGQRPRFDEEDLRSFEWYYLWRLCHRRHRRTLQGHVAPVHGLAFSPDGRTLASGGHDSLVKLWDVATGKELATLRGHRGQIWDVKFSPDGKTLAAGGRDLKLWNLASQREQASFPHVSARCLAFSPDGKTLVYSTFEGENPRLLDLSTGAQRVIPHARSQWASSLAFSPDGKILATCYAVDALIKLWSWDGAVFRERATIPAEDYPLAAFSPDSKLMVFGNRSVKLWDVAAGRERATLGHASGCASMAFSPDGKSVAAARNDRTVRVWDVATGREETIGSHHDPVWSVVFSPDSQTLATASEDRTVKLWSLTGDREADTFWVKSGVIALTPDHQIMAIGNAQGGISLLEPHTGKELAIMDDHATGLGSLMFSPDAKLLASGGAEIKLWDVGTRQQRATFPGRLWHRNALAFAPDGQTLAAVKAAEHDVKLWDLGTKRARATLMRAAAQVISLAFAPDGQTLATAAQFGFVELWDTDTGKAKGMLRGFEGAGDCARGIAFSRDGRMLAAGNDRGTVRVWELSTGQPRATLKGHTDSVLSICFFPDGKTVATGGQDQTVRLWDVATGQERITLKGHQAPVTLVSVAPDGHRLVTASEDGTVKHWRAATDEEARSPRTELDPNDPASPVALNTSADLLSENGRRAEAETTYRQALTRLEKLTAAFPHEPRYRLETLRTLNNLGLAYYQAGRLPEAIRLFEELRDKRVAKLGPEHPETLLTLHNLARAYRAAGRLPEATRLSEIIDERLQRAAGKAIDPRLIRLVVRSLRHFEKLKDAAGCRGTAELWEKLNQNDAGSLYDAASFRAIAAAVIGATDKSEGAAQKAETEADRAMTWLKQAIAAGYDGVARMKEDRDLDALRGREDFKKVVADLAKAAELQTDDPQVLRERGRIHAEAGQFDQAAADFVKALSLVAGSENLIPDSEIFWWPDRAGIDEQLVDRDEVFNAVLKLRPNDPQLWAARAQHYAGRKQWQQAATAMAKVTELAPSVHLGWFLNAPLCLKVGDLEGYRRTCREMLTRSARTKNPYIAERTAKTCSLVPNAVSDRELATKLADQAVTGTEKHIDYRWFVLAKGMADYREGRFTSAITWLGKSLSPNREDPELPKCDALAYLFLAMAHHQLGRPDEARQALDKAGKMTELIADNYFYDRLVVQIVRREAEALLNATKKSSEKISR